MTKQSIVRRISELDKADDESGLGEEGKEKRKKLFVELRDISFKSKNL